MLELLPRARRADPSACVYPPPRPRSPICMRDASAFGRHSSQPGGPVLAAPSHRLGPPALMSVACRGPRTTRCSARTDGSAAGATDRAAGQPRRRSRVSQGAEAAASSLDQQASASSRSAAAPEGLSKHPQQYVDPQGPSHRSASAGMGSTGSLGGGGGGDVTMSGADTSPVMMAPAAAANASGHRHRRKPEVLAPAGGWPQLRAAVENGADAVYFGLSDFNARAR